MTAAAEGPWRVVPSPSSRGSHKIPSRTSQTHPAASAECNRLIRFGEACSLKISLNLLHQKCWRNHLCSLAGSTHLAGAYNIRRTRADALISAQCRGRPMARPFHFRRRAITTTCSRPRCAAAPVELGAHRVAVRHLPQAGAQLIDPNHPVDGEIRREYVAASKRCICRNRIREVGQGNQVRGHHGGVGARLGPHSINSDLRMRPDDRCGSMLLKKDFEGGL